MLGCPGSTAGENPHSRRHANVHLGRESIGHVAGHRKPARGIQQVADGLLNGREFQSLNRSVLVAGDGAVVNESPVLSLALNKGGGGGDADGPVGGPLAIEQLALFIGDLGTLSAG